MSRPEGQSRTPSDRRVCWDCACQIVFPGVDSIRDVDRMARNRGWMYVTPFEDWRCGRMLCPHCSTVRGLRTREKAAVR